MIYYFIILKHICISLYINYMVLLLFFFAVLKINIAQPACFNGWAVTYELGGLDSWSGHRPGFQA